MSACFVENCRDTANRCAVPHSYWHFYIEKYFCFSIANWKIVIVHHPLFKALLLLVVYRFDNASTWQCYLLINRDYLKFTGKIFVVEALFLDTRNVVSVPFSPGVLQFNIGKVTLNYILEGFGGNDILCYPSPHPHFYTFPMSPFVNCGTDPLVKNFKIN